MGEKDTGTGSHNALWSLSVAKCNADGISPAGEGTVREGLVGAMTCDGWIGMNILVNELRIKEYHRGGVERGVKKIHFGKSNSINNNRSHSTSNSYDISSWPEINALYSLISNFYSSLQKLSWFYSWSNSSQSIQFWGDFFLHMVIIQLTPHYLSISFRRMYFQPTIYFSFSFELVPKASSHCHWR